MKGFTLSVAAVLVLTCLLYLATSEDSEASSCSGNNDCNCIIPTVKLANGVEMPQLALGTAVLSSQPGELEEENTNFVGLLPERVYRTVQLALEAGIRHVDSAFIYRSHKPISHVLANWFANGSLERSDVFLTTKIFHPPSALATSDRFMDMENMTPAQVTVAVTRHFEQSLYELGVGYVDLVLLHWPSGSSNKDRSDDSTADRVRIREARARRLAAWKVLESFYEKGWARAIGVSNFSKVHLQQLQEDGATVRPMVNQIETSVYMRQTSIIEYCQEHDIVVQAYSPLGRGVKNMLMDAVVVNIANKHNKTPGQVALRFLVQQGFAVAFSSSSKERMESNMKIFDNFELEDEDMEQLAALNRHRDGTWGLPFPHDLD